MVLDGCLSHKTAVALAALSQYLRFIVSLTSAADHHLLSVNYLVEPYQLPQRSTVAVTKSVHLERVPSHVGNTSSHGEAQQLLARTKDYEHPAGIEHADDADIAVIDVAEVKKFPSDVKIAREEDTHRQEYLRGSASKQDGDYDENMEVELDKDDVRRVRSWDSHADDDEVRQNIVTKSSLVHSVVARAELFAAVAVPRSDRVFYKSRWFLLIVSLFLLLLWFRCIHCLRCGFLLRRCRLI